MGIPFVVMLAGFLILCALPLPAPDIAPPGVRVASETEKRPLALQEFDDFRYFRLEPIIHETRGLDTLGGKALFLGPDRSLYIARAYGVFAVQPDRKAYRYFWVPNAQKNFHIISIHASRTSLWLGLSDGRAARASLHTDAWKFYPICVDTPITLRQAAGSLLAFEKRAGGQIWYLNESADAFEPYFALPPELGVTPIAPLINLGAAWFMGSDLGLFKLGRLGMNSITWELCGTREGLAKTIIQDAAPMGSGLLLAGTQPQHPRLPSNIRPTSYGYFVYNYIQGRWERIAEPLPPKIEHFLGINAANTNLPSNGLWYYESGTDIAHPIRGAEGDFFRVADIRPGLSLAASMRGLYAVGMYQGAYRALRLLELPELWIDDIASDDRDVYILSGRGVFIIAKSNFSQDIFARELTVTVSSAPTAAASSASAAASASAASASGESASSVSSASAASQESAAASQAASEAVSGASVDAGIRDPSGYSEEIRFMRQIEQFLKNLPKD
ncbi:MAG: hypothetical protein LBC99_03235 [Spirochaetota bacterium]|jgi:hypothetical protein|nr:hypothetical protein [Spirochaetota bacterium]